jgi:hypothetical protein
MVLPVSPNAISANDINTELSRTGALSINDSLVRELFVGYTTNQNTPLLQAASTISYENGYGKTAPFRIAITSNTNDVNVRDFAIAQGWDQSRWVILTVNTGVVISTASAGSSFYAMTISGSFPNGLTIINNGTIIGKGGTGGNGGGNPATTSTTLSGTAGTAGARALLVQTACVIRNNGTIAGGGGGGGGGLGVTGAVSTNRVWAGGGGGGGGAGSGSAGSAGVNARSNTTIQWISTLPTNGAVGTLTAGGVGGDGGGVTSQTAAPGTAILVMSAGQTDGGNGGARGASGQTAPLSVNSSGTGVVLGNPGAGGAAGAAIVGISNITFWTTGTILGATS